MGKASLQDVALKRATGLRCKSPSSHHRGEFFLESPEGARRRKRPSKDAICGVKLHPFYRCVTPVCTHSRTGRRRQASLPRKVHRIPHDSPALHPVVLRRRPDGNGIDQRFAMGLCRFGACQLKSMCFRALIP